MFADITIAAQACFKLALLVCGEKLNFSAQELILWNHIINTEIKAVNGVDSEIGIARFTSTKKMLMSVLQQDTTLVRITKKSDRVDVWVGWVAHRWIWTRKKSKNTSIFSSGRRSPLTREVYKPQVRPKDIEIRRNASHAYFYLSKCVEIRENLCLQKNPRVSLSTRFGKAKSGLDTENGCSLAFSILYFCWAWILASFLRSVSWHGNFRNYVYLFPVDVLVHASIIYDYNFNLRISGPGKGVRAHET